MRESIFRDCIEILVKDGKVLDSFLVDCRLSVLQTNLFGFCKLFVLLIGIPNVENSFGTYSFIIIDLLSWLKERERDTEMTTLETVVVVCACVFSFHHFWWWLDFSSLLQVIHV